MIKTEIVGSTSWLMIHAAGNLDALITGVITRDGNGVITSAGVVWPDGVTGVFTANAIDATWGAINSYTVTYVGVTTKTVTQPTMTRDANGSVSNRPAMTVA